jgi:hypothetical protein
MHYALQLDLANVLNAGGYVHYGRVNGLIIFVMLF